MTKIVDFLSGPCSGDADHDCEGEYEQPGGRVIFLCTCPHHEDDDDDL